MTTLAEFLPRVHSLGFRSGQALQQFLKACQGEEGDTFGLSNRLWFQIKKQAPEVWAMVKQFPLWYSTWWMDLLRNDPVHVFVETTLLLSVLYMFLSRTQDWQESKKDKLTKQEEDELIKEWKENGRAPLVSKASAGAAKDVPEFVVHKMEGTSMLVTMDQDPTKYKVTNFGTFDFLGMSAEFTADNKIGQPSSVKREKGFSEEKKEADEEVSGNVEAGATGATEETQAEEGGSKNSKKKKKKKKNAAAKAAQNNGNKDTETTTAISNASEISNPIKKASVEALERYGVGACGPRGFYGTIDPHLKLEEAFTEFMGADGAILYSDGASTVSSTVAAFCKRGDLLVVDEGVREPLIAGVKLSRANIKWFKHNDMEDLRSVMEGVAANDKKLGRAPNAQRRFIICEGLYKNTGLIAPLDEIVALKHKFHYRLILDESFSFGTLGATGRGSLELHNKKLMHDAEVVTIALENALGSIGGITIGNEEVVDHQRLSGSGYCFSAASPPFTASAAIQALNQLKTRPDELLPKLQENQQFLYDKLFEFSKAQEDLIQISSDPRSPIVFLVLDDCDERNYIDETVFLSEVVRECIRRGVAMVSAGHHNTRAGVQLLRAEPQPSIRMCVSAAHSKDEISNGVKVLSESFTNVMERYVRDEI